LCLITTVPTAPQVQYSLLDQRPKGKFTELCAENHIQILAYGTLAGGFVTDKWLNQPEPSTAALTNHSLVLYKPIIDASGGWTLFQVYLWTMTVTFPF